jgi:2-keto-4-pentenoate hydratase/2-oxohepta-3-ene-1,7-dioic acid hydratase in catechol pathway
LKLATFEISTETGPVHRIGIFDNGSLIDLRAAYSLFLVETSAVENPKPLATALFPDDMVAFLKNGREGEKALETIITFLNSRGPDTRGFQGERIRFQLEEVRLLAPIPKPTSIRDFLTFEGHLKGTARTLGMVDSIPSLWYEIPSYYRGSVNNVIGPDEVVQWPSYAQKLDYELEFGVFIGRRGKDIPRQEARDYIAGYTIFNDWSARDVQGDIMSLKMGPAKSKDFDAGNSMGPFLVTPDEIDPDNLTMIARVNGKEKCHANSAGMQFKFDELIADVSRSETLQPGDFLASGTVPGGCGLETDQWIQPGDVIELEVEGIGILRNSVIKI